MRFSCFLCALTALVVALPMGSAKGLTVNPISPAGYQIAPLTIGTQYYVESGAPTVTQIPAALTGGALLRTSAGDASNSNLSVQFSTDTRCEVYVGYDERGTTPTWLASWLRTDMTLDVSDAAVGGLRIYAKRFAAGTITLGANQAPAMYTVILKDSIPLLPRKGWVLLSYDLNYLFEIISQAPQYDINHLELSHDIMMYTHEVTTDPAKRSNVNALIDWAHAYGVPEVTLWTHEALTVGASPSFFAPDGRLNGDNPDMWSWMTQRYVDLFSPALGCPQADGIVLTFDELSMTATGVEVYNRGLFKHDCCSPTQSVAKVINVVEGVCASQGKTLYARTWAGGYQSTVRDAIVANGDSAVWLMNKNVGANDPTLLDWQYMDTYHPLIGTMPNPYREMVEFDLCGEYLGRGPYTFVMTSYVKDHWNDAIARGGADGSTARIDRQGSLPYFGANRLSLYGFSQILGNPNADPAAINLAWCQQHFPPDAAQDIADHYDTPGSPWPGDTRYLTWEAFFPSLSPTTTADAQNIATAAIARLDRHRAQLEIQNTFDERGGKSDYQTLRNGVTLPLLEMGGTVPTAAGFSNFRPTQTDELNPTCSIDVLIPSPGFAVSSVTCEYATDGGTTWQPHPASATGSNGTTAPQTITAAAVPFGAVSDNNRIRFTVQDMAGQLYQSGQLKVGKPSGPTWEGFTSTNNLTPDCSVVVNADAVPLNLSSARFLYSTDGGANWIAPTVTWPNRYECDQLPLAAGWTLAEGHTGYESIVSGTLRIHDTSTNSGDKVKYTRSWSASPSVGATVLARMRCASGGHYFASNLGVSDGQHSETLYLRANGILGLYNSNLIVPFVTTDWHVYRMTIRGQDLNVYADENPQPVIRGTRAFVSPLAQLWVMIGSGSSAGVQDVYYDYVYWTTQGAFAPGEGFVASHTGDSETATLTANSAPFNQYSPSLNRVRFTINDTDGQIYQSPAYTVAVSSIVGDYDDDGDVDQSDFSHLQNCFSGEAFPSMPGCLDADLDGDHDVDPYDFARFLNCMRGPNMPPGC